MSSTASKGAAVRSLSACLQTPIAHNLPPAATEVSAPGITGFEPLGRFQSRASAGVEAVAAAEILIILDFADRLLIQSLMIFG